MSLPEGHEGKSRRKLPAVNLSWPFAGGDVIDIGKDGGYAETPLEPAGPDEIVARVDAVTVCSSDIKLIRMGTNHPLFAERDLRKDPVVLGHEIALTVASVGAKWQHKFHTGQRLGLQPAIVDEGRRQTVGIDRPGGFSQYLRLDGALLGRDQPPYVFEVPRDIALSTIALLEPYACVEAAFRPNARTRIKSGGRLLVACAEGAGALESALDVTVREAVVLGAPASLEPWIRAHAQSVVAAGSLDEVEGMFDDIILGGAAPRELAETLLGRLNEGGLLAYFCDDPAPLPVQIDPARIHYQGISIVGAPGPVVEDAFDPARNRFELTTGGAALIHGAGGAMGRIHVHRALELSNGPELVIATSRRGRRLDALRKDFCPMAERHGKRLIVVEDGMLEATVHREVLGGLDDAIVVAPDAVAMERSTRLLKPDGMLVIFAGTAFGQACEIPFHNVALAGFRVTGSTGCSVQDQLGVLARVQSGELDPSENISAVAGLADLPMALKAVTEGQVSGKVAIYPNLLDLPLTPLSEIKPQAEDENGRWSLEDERRLGVDPDW